MLIPFYVSPTTPQEQIIHLIHRYKGESRSLLVLTCLVQDQQEIALAMIVLLEDTTKDPTIYTHTHTRYMITQNLSQITCWNIFM